MTPSQNVQEKSACKSCSKESTVFNNMSICAKTKQWSVKIVRKKL